MKYFALSDVHGFYDQMLEALDKAGFESENPEHCIVACGDFFDRGKKPEQVMEYFQSLPQKILIRGNHEALLEQACRRGYFYPRDEHNGTKDTVYELSREAAKQCRQSSGHSISLAQRCRAVLDSVEPFFGQMRDYYETRSHIFVHAWIPVLSSGEQAQPYLPRPDWRSAGREEWEKAAWLNPFELSKFVPAEKTVVCGHWHASCGWAQAKGLSEFGPDSCFEPFYGDGFVAIDGCTAFSGQVNVVVIEDEPLE